MRARILPFRMAHARFAMPDPKPMTWRTRLTWRRRISWWLIKRRISSRVRAWANKRCAR